MKLLIAILVSLLAVLLLMFLLGILQVHNGHIFLISDDNSVLLKL